ncbi:MAG: hypothetical protein ACRC0L_03235, partial [Angustibacter sp.]
MTDFPGRLLDWLAGLEPERLTQLLANRPDLSHGVEPSSLAELALRIADPRVIGRVLADGHLPHLQVAEALVALEGDCRLADLVEFCQVNADGMRPHPEQVAHVVEGLESRGLVHQSLDGADRRVCANPGLMDYFGQPLDLCSPLSALLPRRSARELKDILRHWGRPSDALKDEALAQVTALLRDRAGVYECYQGAPASVQKVLAGMADPQSVVDLGLALHGLTPQQRFAATEWGIARGLIQLTT